MLDSFRDTQYKERIVKVEELFEQLRLLEQSKIYIHQIYERFGPLEEAESAFNDLHDQYKFNQEEIEDLKAFIDNLEKSVKEFKKQINAAITSDNTSDGEVVDKLMELLNEYL